MMFRDYVKSLKEIEFKQWLFVILIGSIIIDNINGFFIQTNILTKISVGQIYRFFTYGFILYFFIKHYKLKILYFTPLFIFLGGLPLFYNERVLQVFSEYTYLAKLLYPILLIIVCHNEYKDGKIEISDVYKIINVYMIMAPLSIIIPKIFGVGIYSYNFNSGYRGFYVANNEINIVLLSTFIYSIRELYYKIDKKNIIIAFINLIALFLIGSKTSMIVIAITISGFVIVSSIKKYKGKNLIKFIIYIMGLIIVIGIMFNGYISNIITRLNYFYNMLVIESDNSFLTFLLSGRNTRVLPAIQHNFLENPNELLNLLFGVGRCNQFKENELTSLMEMDFFDTTLWYGIILSTIVLVTYTMILVKGFKNNREYISTIIYLLIYIFALIAGHVWYSPLAGGMFALVATIILSDNEENANEN